MCIEIIAYCGGKSVLFTYLAYASDCLQEEGRARNDIDASKIAIEELLTFATDKEVNDNTTIDELVENILKIACESGNEKLFDKLISLNVEATPVQFKEIFKGMMSRYLKDYDSETTSEEEIWKVFLKACVYGTDEDAPIYSTYPTAKDSRHLYYQLITFKLMELMPSEGYDFAAALFTDDSGEFTGEEKFSNVIDKIYPMLMEVKDEYGDTIKTFSNYAEAADYRLVELIDKLFDKILTDCREKYGESFEANLRKHIENAKENITEIREAFLKFT